jgi:hypothetical protein
MIGTPLVATDQHTELDLIVIAFWNNVAPLRQNIRTLTNWYLLFIIINNMYTVVCFVSSRKLL